MAENTDPTLLSVQNLLNLIYDPVIKTIGVSADTVMTAEDDDLDAICTLGQYSEQTLT